MIRFARRTFIVLDRAARVRFILFALGSVVIAAIEGVGVALVVPLTQMQVGKHGGKLPTAARFVSRLFDLKTEGQATLALAILVVISFSVKAIGAIELLWWGIGNSLDQEARIARRLFTRYLTAPRTYHLAHNSAEIQRTLNEALLIVFRRSLPFVLAAAADAFTLVAVAAVIVVSDPVIASVAIVYFGLVAVVYQLWIGGRQRAAAIAAHAEIALRYQQVQEAMRATKELAILHREEHFISRFYKTKIELASKQRLLILYQLLPRQFLDLAFVLGAALMAAFAFATRTNEQALASVGLFLTASFRLVAPLNRVMGATTVTRTAQPAIDQVVNDLAELDALHGLRAHADVDPLGPVPLELTDVHFRYGEDLPDVLQRISMTIAPGEDVAIVGTTGAGKSTLLDIMLGLLDPQTGEIKVGGRPLHECRTAWQLTIGYVPQDIVLIDDTIRANVAFGIDRADIDDDKVWEALRIAQIDTFVASLSGGIDNVVGEQGVRLSGGQRQRLGLARAMYDGPAVLVLDEATSSLDSSTEARIIETIASLRGRLTIITVSHRLSTLKHCDRIYYLRDGSVVAVGTLDELRACDREFAELVTFAELGTSRPSRDVAAGVNGEGDPADVSSERPGWKRGIPRRRP
ncbi:MAG TPA: ABC transporter ATP-binding protein [Acidimicrobiales bacterium]|nr:ABC transporter ATP-binding protein [Acidimicrobiales bacterium]